MNILIVDDEILAIENVETALENIPASENRGGRNVFRAFNISEAKNIIGTEEIDLLLCDIEMPSGNGLELIRWVYENNYEMECIMITCFADFDYIRNAMKYGVTGYILKPIDLEEFQATLEKAYKNITITNSKMRKNMEQYLSSKIRETSLKKEKNKKAELTEAQRTDFYWGIFLSVKYRPIKFYDWDKKSTCFILVNIANEILHIKEEDCSIVLNEFQQIFLIHQRSGITEEEIETQCNKMIDWFMKEEGWKLNLYLTKCKVLDEVIDDVNRMVEEDKECGSFGKCKRFPIAEWHKNTGIAAIRRTISALLDEDKYKETRKIIEKLTLEKISKNEMLDLLQVFYGKLSGKHILISELIDEKGEKLYQNFATTLSMEAFCDYMDYLLVLLERNSKHVIDPNEVCNLIKAYISINIDHPLTRDELSNYVHLNADYLNRIFKKQNGESLMSYVIREKMETAKKLLKETAFNITKISEMVGYDNYSYFATSFKKYEGISAKKYRDGKDENERKSEI